MIVIFYGEGVTQFAENVVMLKNVYLLVRHVPFIAKGAGFLLQCTKCSRQATFVHGSPKWQKFRPKVPG